MQHIPALKKPTQSIIEVSAMLGNLVGHYLLAIFHNTPKSFGLDTTFAHKEFMNRFQSLLIKDFGVTPYADSGGYDYICGRIHPRNAYLFIESYLYALRSVAFERFFTLDFAYNLKYPEFNNDHWLYDINKHSLAETVQVIKNNPTLMDKMHFVWHGSSWQLYQIFSRLFTELECGNYMQKFAIGGLVGWKRATGCIVSPIIWMSYRCFYEYLNHVKPTKSFALHFLGIKNPVDRFVATLLEQLFSAYMTKILGVSEKCQVSYDTSSYCRAAAHRAYKLQFNQQNEDTIIQLELVDVPERITRKVYFQDRFHRDYSRNLDRILNKKRLDASNIFMPINTLSQLNLDSFFQKTIQDYRLTDLYFSMSSADDFMDACGEVVHKFVQDHPTGFTSQQGVEIRDSMVAIYDFHQWLFPRVGGVKELDSLVLKYLTKANRVQ